MRPFFLWCFFLFPSHRGLCVFNGYLQKVHFNLAYCKIFMWIHLIKWNGKPYRKQRTDFHTIRAQEWLNESRWTSWWKYVHLHFTNVKREKYLLFLHPEKISPIISGMLLLVSLAVRFSLAFQPATTSYAKFSLWQN